MLEFLLYMESFRGVLDGPRVLKLVRNAALTCAPEQTKQAITGVLNTEGYTLSRQQKQLLPAVASFAKDREAVATAARIHHAFPAGFRETVAAQAKIDPDQIEELNFNPVSVTISLKTEEFQRVWKERQGTPGSGKPVTYPGGFCNLSDQFTVAGRIVHFNFMDARRAPKNTPQHEDLHNQYDYLHPKRTVIPKARRGIKAFTRFAEALTEARMEDYLNEVASQAASKLGHIVHEDFWSYPLYYDRFRKKVEKAQQQMPKNPVARLQYQAVLDEHLELLRYRTDTVRSVFSMLEGFTIIMGRPKRKVDQDYNVAFAQFLTAESGFAASAIEEDRAPTPAEARRWKNAPVGPRGEERVAFWKDVVLRAAEPTKMHYSNQEGYIFLYVKFSEALSDEIDPDPACITEQSITAYVQAMSGGLREPTEKRFKAVQRIFGSKPFEQLPITDEQRRAIRHQVILTGIGFHKYFRSLLLNMHQPLQGNFTSRGRQLYDHYSNTMVAQWLSLEDAADELAAALLTGQKPNYKQIFTPGFHKSDYRNHKLLECIESRGKVRIFDESPLEAATLGIFRTRFINGMIPVQNSREINKKEIAAGAASLFVRLLNWAEAQGLSAEETKTTREYLNMLLGQHLVPPFLEPRPKILHPVNKSKMYVITE